MSINKTTKTKSISFWLFSSLSLGVLLLLLYRERSFLETLTWHWDWKVVGGSFLFFMLGLLLAAFVWANLMQAFRSQLPISSHIAFFMISNVAKRLPGTIWYIVGRGYLYKQQNESLRLVSIASTVELIIQTASGILVAIIFGGFSLPSQLPLPWWFSSFILLFGLGVLLLLPHLVTAWTPKLLGTQVSFTTFSFNQVFRWTILYMLIWVLGGCIFFFVASLYTPLPFTALPFYISVWCTVGVLSITVFFLPSNFGITEVGLSLFLSSVMPSSIAVLISLTTRMITLGFEFALAVGVLLLKRPFEWPFRRVIRLE